MSLSNTTRRKWWENYEDFDAELDKLSDKELNYLLKSKIADTDSHVANKEIHVSKEEKAKWNSFKGYPLATESSDGLISQEEKDKLNLLDENANNYVHPSYNGSSLRNTYQYKISNTGHITDMTSVNYLPVTVNNVFRVGGLDFSKFITVDTTDFFRLSTPDVDASKAINNEKLINVKTLKANSINSAVTNASSFPSDKSKLFYNQKDKTLYYYDEKNTQWKKIISVDAANMVMTNADGKIDSSLIKKNAMPIGSFITINSKSGLGNSKYLLCNGNTIKRSDYSELFKLLDIGAVYSISNSEYESIYTSERNIDTEFKSCYAFVWPADGSTDSIRLPNIHMTNIRAQAYTNNLEEMFYKESTRNISGKMPVFNFYDKNTNTLIPVYNDTGTNVSIENENTYVQNPFDKWSASKRGSDGHILYGGSFYSFEGDFTVDENADLTKLNKPDKNSYIDKQTYNMKLYKYDNSTVYNTNEKHNYPASTYVSMYVKVRE